MKYLYIFIFLIACSFSYEVQGQETYVFLGNLSVTNKGLTKYQMWKFNFENNNRTLLFELDSTYFPQIFLNNYVNSISSFEYDKKNDIFYFLAWTGELYQYDDKIKKVDFIKDFTPENKSFLWNDYTRTAQIDALNDSIYYISGCTNGFLDIRDFSFDIKRQCPSFILSGTQAEREKTTFKFFDYKDKFISYSYFFHFMELNLANPDLYSFIMDSERLKYYSANFLNFFTNYRSCKDIEILSLGTYYLDGWASDSILMNRIDLENKVTTKLPSLEGFGLVNGRPYDILDVQHYPSLAWEDCQRRIDLDIDDSTASDRDYRPATYCDRTSIALADLDLELRNEGLIDSIVLTSNASGLLSYIITPNGELQLDLGGDQAVWTGAVSNGAYLSAITNSTISLPASYIRDSFEVRFVVWYGGIAGKAATAYIRLAVRPDAGLDTRAVICSQDSLRSLGTFIDPAAQVGGAYYDAAYSAITRLPMFVADSITYYYIVSNAYCQDTAQVVVNLVPSPSITPISDIYVCNDDTSTVAVTALNSARIRWGDGNTSFTRTNLLAGSYSYTVSNAYGCTVSDTFNIVSVSSTTPYNLTTIQICQGASYNFRDQDYNLTGIYADTVSSVNGCDSLIYQLNLRVIAEQPFAIVGDTSICAGETTSIIVDAGGRQLILDDQQVTSPIIVGQSGTYMISAIDEFGCIVKQTFTVDVEAMPSVLTRDLLDTTLQQNIPLPVAYEGSISHYLWSGGDNLSCYECPFPELVGGIGGTYEVEVTTEAGCVGYGVIRVTIKSQDYYLPNIILNRPNVLENGIFGLKSSGALSYSISIYDRWGNLIYNNPSELANDPNGGWRPDGKYNPGVYVYLIGVVVNGEARYLKGDVTLW